MLVSSTFINLQKTLHFAGLGNWERGFGKRHEPELQSWRTYLFLLHLDGGMLSPSSWTRMPTGGLPRALRSWGPVRLGCFPPEPLHTPCRELPISNGTRSWAPDSGQSHKLFLSCNVFIFTIQGISPAFFPLSSSEESELCHGCHLPTHSLTSKQLSKERSLHMLLS